MDQEQQQKQPSANPFAPPAAAVADITSPHGAAETARLNRVASGQRLVVIAVLIELGLLVLGGFMRPLVLPIALACSIVTIVGVVRATGALGSHPVARVLYALGMMVPLLNLLVMLRVSSRCTRVLREAGYRVGLLGASARQAAG